MTCDVTSCDNQAVVLITFDQQRRPIPYCRYHAFHKSGRPRWKKELIRSMEKVGSRQ